MQIREVKMTNMFSVSTQPQKEFEYFFFDVDNMDLESYKLFAIFITLCTKKNVDIMMEISEEEILYDSAYHIDYWIYDSLINHKETDVEEWFDKFEVLASQMAGKYQTNPLYHTFSIMCHTIGLINLDYLSDNRRNIINQLKEILLLKVDFYIMEKFFHEKNTLGKNALMNLVFSHANVDIIWVLALLKDNKLSFGKKLGLIKFYGENCSSMHVPGPLGN